jgi:hypothetical protein
LEHEAVIARAERAELHAALGESMRQVRDAAMGQQQAADRERLASESADALVAELAGRARERDALADALEQVTIDLRTLQRSEFEARTLATSAFSELDALLATRTFRWSRRPRRWFHRLRFCR